MPIRGLLEAIITQWIQLSLRKLGSLGRPSSHFPPVVVSNQAILIMLRSPTFWEEESDSSLLKLNYGYLKPNAQSLLERVSTWLTLAEVPSLPSSSCSIWELPEVEDPDRLLAADAFRTFRYLHLYGLSPSHPSFSLPIPSSISSHPPHTLALSSHPFTILILHQRNQILLGMTPQERGSRGCWSTLTQPLKTMLKESLWWLASFASLWTKQMLLPYCLNWILLRSTSLDIGKLEPYPSQLMLTSFRSK